MGRALWAETGNFVALFLGLPARVSRSLGTSLPHLPPRVLKHRARRWAARRRPKELLDLNPHASVLSNRREVLQQVQAVVQLTKPSVTRMVLVTTVCGAVIAPGAPDWLRVGIALVGTAMVVAAANVFNMAWEPEVDSKMRRTRTRPIPTGRVSREAAVLFGALLAVFGLAILRVGVGALPTLLCAVALASYVLLYTPLKAVTPWSLQIGAVPGALPPVIGWTSMTGSLTLDSLSVFAVLFMWQIPHFLAISVFRRSEYENAGLRVLSVVGGVRATKHAIASWTLALVVTTFLPYLLGLAGGLYIGVALVAGLVFAGVALAGLTTQDDERWARRVFLASMPYLLLLLSAWLISAP